MVNTNLMFCVNTQPAKGIWNCGVMGMGEEKNQQLGFSNWLYASYIVSHCSRMNSLSAGQEGCSIQQLQNCFTVNSVGEKISS